MTLGPARFQTESQPLSLLRIPFPIDVFQVQTSAGTAFTATHDFQIESLIAANVSGVSTYLTVYLVPSGGSAGTDNMIVHEKVIPANDGAVIFDRNNVGFMRSGMTLRALCGVNDAVNLYGYGYDYQGQYST